MPLQIQQKVCGQIGLCMFDGTHSVRLVHFTGLL
jgi:hypothetical protein